MFNIGPQELLVILLVALVIVGPQRLPELARTIGRWMRELRRAQEEVTRTIQLGLDEAEPTKPTFPKPAAATRREPQRAEEGEEGASAGEGDEGVADVARTLGRGLAEIRRARRELQRTFRVDLAEEPPAPRPSPPPSRPPAAPQGSSPEPAPTDPPAGEG